MKKNRVEMENGWQSPKSQIKKVRKNGSWYQIEFENGVKAIARVVTEHRELRSKEREM